MYIYIYMYISIYVYIYMCVYIYIYINRNTAESINKNNSFILRLVSSVHADSSGLNDKFTATIEFYMHYTDLLI